MNSKNVKHIKLVISDDSVKKRYCEFIRDIVKIPICNNCSKFFELGFPNTETGILDNLICFENDLICDCEYSKIVKKLYNSKEDGIIDVISYYH